MKKAKLLSLLVLLPVLMILSAKLFHVNVMAEDWSAFEQILNDEGKLVVTDTTMSENMTQFLDEYLQKYYTSEYYFYVSDYNEADSTCDITVFYSDCNESKNDVVVVFQENISEEFKTILKSGKLQIPSSTKNELRDKIGSLLLRVNNENYRFTLASESNLTGYSVLIDEDGTKATIQMYDSNNNLLEQHIVELSYLTEMSEAYKNNLNEAGKLVFNSIKPDDEVDWGYMLEMLFPYMEKGFSYSNLADDLSSVDLTINYGKEDEETHNVGIIYNYDEAVAEKFKEFIKNFPEDTFHVRDLEIINYWVNNVANDDTESMDLYSGDFKEAVNNSNIEYYVDNRAGENGLFFTIRGGVGIFKYNDIAYHLNTWIETSADHIIYVPDTTGSSRDELIAAAQNRINEYLGRDDIVTVSYGGTVLDAWIDFEYEATRWEWESEFPDWTKEEWKAAFMPAYSDFGEDIIGMDGVSDTDDSFIITVKVGDKEKQYKALIIRDSSKMITPSYKTADISTNVEISSSSASVPLDTILRAELLTGGSEYENILKLLNVNESVTFDLKLYSGSLKGYITKLEDGSFKVSIPVSDELKGKNLVVYYVDENNKIVEYEVYVEDGYAVFTTNHFSIYTLAEKNGDVEAGDGNGMILWLGLTAASITALGMTVVYRKKACISR